MTDFAAFVETVIAELADEGKGKIAETRRYSAGRFLKYMGSRPVPMEEWDDRFVLGYQRWLTAQGLSASTTAYYLAQLCAFYRLAVKRGLLPDRSVFRLVDKTPPPPQRSGRRLPSVAELRYLRGLVLPVRQAFARDMFLFSLYTRGMNFVDMAYLKKTDVSDGMLTYTSHASDCNPAVTIRWDSAMQKIADTYSPATEYLLPIITGAENGDTMEQITRSRHKVVGNLRAIGRQYRFSVAPTFAMTKDLWRKIMDEVSVSEVI